MKKRKLFIVLGVVGIISIGLIFLTYELLKDNSDEDLSANSKIVSEESLDIEENEKDVEPDYLLESYPIEPVPLYQVTEVSSSKLYNNWDKNNISTFDDEEFTYYNVVFYTESEQDEFLNYYKGVFDEEIFDEYPIPDMVKGNIGKYRVTAAHYGSDDTAYIQVYLPQDEVTRENIYFDTYPDLFALNPMFVEEENSYGLLNQVGGQIEYTKYFSVIDSGDADNDGNDDVDEFEALIGKYQELYKNKDKYEFDTASGLMSWEDDGYLIKVSFSEDHGRVYLNIRGRMVE